MTLVVITVASIFDLRTRRIPNFLTFGGAPWPFSTPAPLTDSPDWLTPSKDGWPAWSFFFPCSRSVALEPATSS